MELIPDDGRKISVPVEHGPTRDQIRLDLLTPEDAALYRQRRDLMDRCWFSSLEIWESLTMAAGESSAHPIDRNLGIGLRSL